MDVKSELSQTEQVKLAAQNEVRKERFDKAKDELVKLYRKLESAKEVIKNIEREITDYEMTLEGK